MLWNYHPLMISSATSLSEKSISKVKLFMLFSMIYKGYHDKLANNGLTNLVIQFIEKWQSKYYLFTDTRKLVKESCGMDNEMIQKCQHPLRVYSCDLYKKQKINLYLVSSYKTHKNISKTLLVIKKWIVWTLQVLV